MKAKRVLGYEALSSASIFGAFFSPTANITQYQPLKIISMPMNNPMTTMPVSGH